MTDLFAPLTAEEINSENLPQEEYSILRGLAHGAAQGATFGFSDELMAALKAIPENDKGESFVERYRKKRDIEREESKAIEEAQPTASLIGGLAGGLAVPIPGAGILGGAKGAKALLASSPTKEALLKIMGKGALAGAGYGAAFGLGAGEADLTQGEIPEAAGEMLKGAEYGAIAGAALPAAGRAISKGAKYVSEIPAVEKLTDTFKFGKEGVDLIKKLPEMEKEFIEKVGGNPGETGKLGGMLGEAEGSSKMWADIRGQKIKEATEEGKKVDITEALMRLKKDLETSPEGLEVDKSKIFKDIETLKLSEDLDYGKGPLPTGSKPLNPEYKVPEVKPPERSVEPVMTEDLATKKAPVKKDVPILKHDDQTAIETAVTPGADVKTVKENVQSSKEILNKQQADEQLQHKNDASDRLVKRQEVIDNIDLEAQRLRDDRLKRRNQESPYELKRTESYRAWQEKQQSVEEAQRLMEAKKLQGQVVDENEKAILEQSKEDALRLKENFNRENQIYEANRLAGEEKTAEDVSKLKELEQRKKQLQDEWQRADDEQSKYESKLHEEYEKRKNTLDYVYEQISKGAEVKVSPQRAKEIQDTLAQYTPVADVHGPTAQVMTAAATDIRNELDRLIPRELRDRISGHMTFRQMMIDGQFTPKTKEDMVDAIKKFSSKISEYAYGGSPEKRAEVENALSALGVNSPSLSARLRLGIDTESRKLSLAKEIQLNLHNTSDIFRFIMPAGPLGLRLAHGAGSLVRSGKQTISSLGHLTDNLVKTLPEDLQSMAIKFKTVSQDYANILEKAAKLPEVQRRAVMFGLAQRPDFREHIRKMQGEEE